MWPWLSSLDLGAEIVVRFACLSAKQKPVVRVTTIVAYFLHVSGSLLWRGDENEARPRQPNAVDAALSILEVINESCIQILLM